MNALDLILNTTSLTEIQTIWLGSVDRKELTRTVGLAIIEFR